MLYNEGGGAHNARDKLLTENEGLVSTVDFCV